MRRTALCLAAVCVLAWTAQVRAHFLFTRICPPAEGGRSAEVYFSEFASAGDPRFIDKIAGAKFFVQTSPGEFRPLAMRQLSDRLRGHLPTQGAAMVAGQLDYGVLERPLQKPFLLRHYSKAVAGSPAEVNQLKPHNDPVEVVATFENDQVVLTALVQGKPYGGTTFFTVDESLGGDELKADAEGRVTFKPGAPGVYCVCVKHVEPTAGENDGKKYAEVREFATLSFAWPLASSAADPAAVHVFEEALAARAAWKDFTGFSAKIAGEVEGRPFSGTVDVAADGGVKLKLEDDAVEDWVESQLASITMHRASSQTPSQDRPKPVLRFADAQDHPLGRLLVFDGGHFASSYRVKDKQITVVNRLLDGKNMTITVLENEKNADGQFLPRSYGVQYWDEATGKLERSEMVQDRFVRLGKWDLPQEHTVTTSSDGGYSVRSLRLSEHKLAETAK